MGEQERLVLGSGGMRGGGTVRPAWPWLDGFKITPGPIAPEARRQAPYPFAIRSDEPGDVPDEPPSTPRDDVPGSEPLPSRDTPAVREPDRAKSGAVVASVAHVADVANDPSPAAPSSRHSRSIDDAPPAPASVGRPQVDAHVAMPRTADTVAEPKSIDVRVHDSPAAPSAPPQEHAFLRAPCTDTAAVPAARRRDATAPTADRPPSLLRRQDERIDNPDAPEPPVPESGPPIVVIRNQEVVSDGSPVPVPSTRQNTVPATPMRPATTYVDRLVLASLRGAASRPARRTVHIGTLKVTVRAPETASISTPPVAAARSQPAPAVQGAPAAWINAWARYHAIED